MDKNDEYFPQNAREKVIIYQLLCELDHVMDRSSAPIFGIIPVSATSLKNDIRTWIQEHYKLMADDD